MSPQTRSGVEVVREGYPPSYVYVIGIPPWLCVVWLTLTAALIGVGVWCALEIRGAKALAHDDANGHAEGLAQIHRALIPR